MGGILTCVKLTVSAPCFIELKDIQCGVELSIVEGILQVIGEVNTRCKGKSGKRGHIEMCHNSTSEVCQKLSRTSHRDTCILNSVFRL